MSNGQLTTDIKEATGDLFLGEVNHMQQMRAMQRQVYAQSCGLPGIVPNAGITKTINNFTIPPDPQTPAPATQPSAQPPATTPQGMSGLMKAGIAAAAIAGTGGIGLLGLGVGTAIPWLASKFSATPAIAAPATPNGQVTIGINPDGTLYDPNAGTAK